MPEPPAQAVVEFYDGAPDDLERLAEENPDEVTILSASSFNAADPTVIGALIVLTPAVLTAITTIVKAHLEARKNVKVKVKGIEITGMKAQDAVTVLRELGERSAAVNDVRVAAHLAATRITGLDAQAEGQLAEVYREWHAELTRRLRERFTDLEPIELFVACTANAKSELLTTRSGDVGTIVHDQHLGRTLNRLTQFVIARWPPSRVHAWAFERIAIASLADGDLDATQLALALSMMLRTQEEPPQTTAEQNGVRSVMATIQEFFVLAHEVAHTALGEQAHDRLQRHFRDELERAINDRLAVRSEHADAIREQMVNDVSQAVSRHLGGGDPTPEQRAELGRMADSGDELDEAAWLRERPYLYEEIACDLIATELTLEHFAELDVSVDVAVVLPAILMALHHLTSLEYLEAIADPAAHDAEDTLKAAVVRKSAWRHMTIRMYDPESPVVLGETYVAVTQDHAAWVGDQVLFIVPTAWRDARRRLAEQQVRADPGPPDAMRLHSIVWELASPIR